MLGLIYHNKSDIKSQNNILSVKFYDKAIKYLKISSETNKKEASHLLGEIYREKNETLTSFFYFQRADELGCKYSSFELRQMYLGIGDIQRDLKKAIYYFERSEKDDSFIHYLIGGFYSSDPS